ncbi:Uncharacterised protein [uncultured archaeon]|nr:Uncharacterised protein [uncultured archaeon]
MLWNDVQNWFKGIKDKISNSLLRNIKIFPPYVDIEPIKEINSQNQNYFLEQDYLSRKILPCDEKEGAFTPKFSDWRLMHMLKEFREIYLETWNYDSAIKKFNELHRGYSEEFIYEVVEQYKNLRKKHCPEYIALHMPDILPFKELGEREFQKLEEAVFLYSKLLSSYKGTNQNRGNKFENQNSKMYNDLGKIAEQFGISASKIQSATRNMENNLEVQKYRHEQFGYKANEISEHDLVNIYLEKESGATYDEIVRRYHLASRYSAKRTYELGKEVYEKLKLENKI